MNKEFFEIVTLHDCAGCNNKRNNLRKKNTMLRNNNGLGDLITDIITAIGGIFGGGGRSGAQITADEQASGAYFWEVQRDSTRNPGHHDYGLSLDQVYAILRPGWNAGENYDRLLERFMSALRAIDYGGPLPGQASIFSGDSGIIPLLLIGGLVFSFMSKKTSRRKK